MALDFSIDLWRLGESSRCFCFHLFHSCETCDIEPFVIVITLPDGFVFALTFGEKFKQKQQQHL